MSKKANGKGLRPLPLYHETTSKGYFHGYRNYEP